MRNNYMDYTYHLMIMDILQSFIQGKYVLYMKLQVVYYIICIQSLWTLINLVLHLFMFVQHVSLNWSKTVYHHYQLLQELILAIIDALKASKMPNLHESIILSLNEVAHTTIKISSNYQGHVNVGLNHIKAHVILWPQTSVNVSHEQLNPNIILNNDYLKQHSFVKYIF